MLTVAQLRERATILRAKQAKADEALVSEIESDVAEYRAAYPEPRDQEPPDEMARRLPLMGWLMYEVTWDALQRVAPAYESLEGERRDTSVAAAGVIRRVADAARALPWPEFAPRALGAIRAQALTASKRDTEAGYDQAWLFHQEAREKHGIFKASHGQDPSRATYRRALDEALLQLALAETGTACRTAELVIGRWAEQLGKAWTHDDGDRWTQRMFRELFGGVATGEEALDLAEWIDKEYGLVDEVTEERSALRTSYQNPGIMTARAALLMLALAPEMERLGRTPLGEHESWASMREDLLNRFERAYRRIEEPVLDENGQPEEPKADHLRSIVQLRLNLALLAPGRPLPARLRFHPCVALDPLDDDAVAAMSRWLVESVNGRQRGDANVIGSATKPRFVESVEACRTIFNGSRDGYREWRRQWFRLDRYSGESGRRERVEELLGPVADTPD